MMVRELDSAGVSKATYLQGASGAVYRREDLANGGQSVKWYVYDGLGSVACELNPNGTVAGRRKVDVYGMTRSTAGSGGKHGFVGSLGHTTDETGLIYMRARHYDPVTGRFASEDPAGHGENWYAYCGGDPVGRIDKDGKVWSLSAFGLEINAYQLAGMLGVAFAAAAFYSFTSRTRVLENAGRHGNFGIGTESYHNAPKLVIATALAGFSTLFFGLSAIGIITGDIWRGLVSSLGILSGVIQIMTASAQTGGTTRAGVAVLACFVYGLTVAGFCIATNPFEMQ